MRKAFSYLAAFMLLGAIFISFPYGYYQVLKLVSCIAFVLCFLEQLSCKKTLTASVFLLMGIIFNPIIPVHFEKSIWMLLDAIGILLLFLYLLPLKLIRKAYG